MNKLLIVSSYEKLWTLDGKGDSFHDQSTILYLKLILVVDWSWKEPILLNIYVYKQSHNKVSLTLLLF